MLKKKVPHLRFVMYLKNQMWLYWSSELMKSPAYDTVEGSDVVCLFICLLKTMHCRIGMFYFPTQCVNVTVHKITPCNLRDTNCTVWLQTREIELRIWKRNATNIVNWIFFSGGGDSSNLHYEDRLWQRVGGGGWGCKGYVYIM